MTLSVRRTVAALAVGAALVLAGCGWPRQRRRPRRRRRRDRSSPRPRCRRPWPRSTRWTPRCSSRQLTPSGTLTALVQAPVVLELPRRQGRQGLRLGRDARGRAPRHRRPGRVHPRDHQARHGHLRRPADRPDHRGRRPRADPAAAGAGRRRQPALRHVRPADGLDRASPRPSWVTAARRGAVTDGRLGAGRHLAPRRARAALARCVGGRRRRHGAPGPQSSTSRSPRRSTSRLRRRGGR